MRTKVQQNKTTTLIEERNMAKDLKVAWVRNTDTILMDAMGVVALGVILFVGLSLPAIV